ncbi:hypothetical protein [Kriegella aquimaris]|uniref:Lipocalin-like domain-containing protein n=1 Tax=Kriegella aquimaris TaxID=192904 RepID=A0A1G9I6A0_9FLAO|nr:hypothetical protein [Kriegella aquimaris]SDL20768.1 hypothetical protein SAMN04488514_10114 [Kriegella aquimaris]
MKYGLLLFVLTLLCCSKDDKQSLTSSDLKGKWIETETRKDTLFFESLDNLDFMNLNRGKELRNGNLLPKPKSGPYRYKLLEEKISLNWVLSSDSSFNDYYLKVINNRLNIGNFYGSTLGETLTFEKLD